MRGVLLSFQQVDFVNAPTWVGFDNFRRLFDDPLFGVAWRNTLLFTGLALVFGFAVPFLTAVLLNEIRHAKAFFRLAVYLPVMLPPVVTALMWKWFYDPGPGLFNSALGAVGLPGGQWLDSSTHRDAVAGVRLDVGQHGQHHADLPGRARHHPRRAVRSRGARRRRAVAARCGT